MGLLEWFSESNNPHRIGEIKSREASKKEDPINWLALMFGQAFFWTCFYFILKFSHETNGSIDVKWLLIVAGFFISYLLIGYFFDVQPDYDNVGLLGGVFDHPFRYTDDFNRFLIFLKVIFFPAYIMSKSWVELWRCWKQNS